MLDDRSTIVHHLTVDVEEYFHPTAMVRHFPASKWDGLERRSSRVVAELLDFLEERGVSGTFFVLGWLAEREPDMVLEIHRRGHEIASHGFEHQLLVALGPEGFRRSIRESKRVLEDISGHRVRGYRAPSFSITPGLEWAFDILLEEGYEYDASLFPITQHPTYGYPLAPREPHWIAREGGQLAEFPALTARVLGSTVPASGGAYFRLLPYQLVRTGFRQAVARGVPGMFYIHPWELDSWMPDVDAPWLQRFRTFSGRDRSWTRMDRLLSEFEFGRVADTFEAMGAGSSPLTP